MLGFADRYNGAEKTVLSKRIESHYNELLIHLTLSNMNGSDLDAI